MLHAHQDHRSLVATLPEDAAEQRVSVAHQVAKEAGYPLRFVMTREQ